MESFYTGLNRVLTYIDDHPAEDLSLPALSQISGYSPYHFHRMFHAVTGRTLHEYVLLRKVNAAANRLLYDRCSITQIAFDCGFASSGSFTRCFRNHMRCSPSYYRKNKSRKRPLDLLDIQIKPYTQNDETDSLFSVIEWNDIQAAGIVTKGLSGNFESKAVEAAFEKLFAWIAKSGLDISRSRVMGITLDTPEVVSLAECRYFACVSMDGALEPEGEVSVRTFPLKGDFIRFSLLRTGPNFTDAFFQTTDYLYGCYMPRIGCYPDNRPFVEVYTQSGSNVAMGFHVPVRWENNG
jgi:AraC family transcriptional regulator